jgi:hypothetical protein
MTHGHYEIIFKTGVENNIGAGIIVASSY